MTAIIGGAPRTCRISGIPGQESDGISFFSAPMSAGAKLPTVPPVSREEFDALAKKVDHLIEVLAVITVVLKGDGAPIDHAILKASSLSDILGFVEGRTPASF